MIFIPKFGDKVYFINWEGNIVTYVICNSEQSTHLIKSGNCYRTEEDAVRARNRIYAKTEIYRFYIEYSGEHKSEFDFIFNLEVNDEFTNLVKEKFGCEKLELIKE